MRRIEVRRGVVRYEKERSDLVQEAVVAMAQQAAMALEDDEAAKVGALFPQWMPGTAYKTGERISDEEGNLYRVVQNHTAQDDWPMDRTPALYTPLGVTEENPEEIPEWRQPLGAEDAYHTGDRVKYQGKTYECTEDNNVWAPDVRGWTEVTE